MVNQAHGFADGRIPLDVQTSEALKEAHWHLNAGQRLTLTGYIDPETGKVTFRIEQPQMIKAWDLASEPSRQVEFTIGPIEGSSVIADLGAKDLIGPVYLHRLKVPMCHAASDGECFWENCPQLKDGEPKKSGRHCPLDDRCDDELCQNSKREPADENCRNPEFHQPGIQAQAAALLRDRAAGKLKP